VEKHISLLDLITMWEQPCVSSAPTDTHLYQFL
jgi:hypothetical protein